MSDRDDVTQKVLGLVAEGKEEEAVALAEGHHGDDVYGWLVRRLDGNHAVAQEILDGLHGAGWNLAKFEGRASLRSWMLGAARNRAWKPPRAPGNLDDLLGRREPSLGVADGQANPFDLSEESNPWNRTEVKAYLARAIARLEDPEDRRIMELRHSGGQVRTWDAVAKELLPNDERARGGDLQAVKRMANTLAQRFKRTIQPKLERIMRAFAFLARLRQRHPQVFDLLSLHRKGLGPGELAAALEHPDADAAERRTGTIAKEVERFEQLVKAVLDDAQVTPEEIAEVEALVKPIDRRAGGDE